MIVDLRIALVILFIFVADIGSYEEKRVIMGRCPSGFLHFESSCYYVDLTRRERSVANTECVNMKSYLVEIETMKEHSYLVSTLSTLLLDYPSNNIQFWTGGARIGKKWTWNDREGLAMEDEEDTESRYQELTFTDWRSDQPSQDEETAATIKYANNIWGWNDIYTNKGYRLRYICEKASLGDSTCPSRWVYFSGSCYYFSIGDYIHRKAVGKCQRRRSHLVALNSKEENEFVKQQIRTKVGGSRYEEWWIGAVRLGGPGGKFIWDVTSDVDKVQPFSRWLRQPDPSDRRMPFTYMILIYYGGQWWWSNDDREQVYPCICKAPAGERINGTDFDIPACQPEAIEFEGYCYEFSTELMTRHNAEKMCMFFSDHLVSLRSEEEMEFVVTQLNKIGPMKYDRWWTGGMWGGDTWMWSEDYAKFRGAQNKFKAWFLGEPNNYGGQEKYISLKCDDQGIWGWNDIAGTTVVRIPLICEKDAGHFDKSEYGIACKEDIAGTQYRGTINETRDGIPCQNWTSQWPNQHHHINPEDFPDEAMDDAGNSCRNPDGKAEGPWCFMADKTAGRWAYCDIPLCEIVPIIEDPDPFDLTDDWMTDWNV